MATKVVPAALTIVHEEKITLNGVEKGSKVTQVIADVTEVSQRIVNVPTSEVVILVIGSAVAAGQFVESDVRYIRLTNKDDTNHVTLTFKNENDDEFAVKLDYGQSFVYNGDLAGGVADTMDAIDGTGLSLGLGDLVNITALANGSPCDLELFVAGV